MNSSESDRWRNINSEGNTKTRGLRWVRLVTEGDRAIIPTNSLRALQKEG